MDLKAKIEELVSKLQGDKDLLTKFQSNPVPTVESLLGIDLPDDQVQKVVEGIKARLKLDGVTGKLGGLGGKLGGLLGK